MSEHLDELALEALATGRADLAPEGARAHAEGCARCRALVEAERESARDAGVALRRAAPDVGDLDALIAKALAAAPEPGDTTRAPSRSSLWLGGALGGLAAAALALRALPAGASVEAMRAAGRQGLTLARAVDAMVESALPGGWALVALLGLVGGVLLALPLRWLLGTRGPGSGLVPGALGLGLALALGLSARPAHAYRVEGEWPMPERRVTLDVEGRLTSEALRLAAESAGLGLVARLAEDPPVTLHVRDAPLPEVVQALLGDAPVVVVPGPRLLTVRAAPAPAAEPDPAAEPVGARARNPAPSPAPTAVGDRVTFGGDVEIGAEEVVRAVYTMGGDARVVGRALGDVVTMGGDAEIVGEVFGNVTTMGGDVALRSGARVHGDLSAMGGRIDVDEGAVLHGRSLRSGGSTPSQAALETVSRGADAGEGVSPTLYRWALWHALLFLLGLVMLGTRSRQRLSVLCGELAARPIRSTFSGFFALLAGALLALVLVLTLVGSPGALVLGGVIFVGVCMGWTAVAAWLGGVLPLGLLKDRPVLQLAVGLGVLFLVGLVPILGTLVTLTAVLAGVGAVLATNFGKYQRPRRARHEPRGPSRHGAR